LAASTRTTWFEGALPPARGAALGKQHKWPQYFILKGVEIEGLRKVDKLAKVTDRNW